MTHDPTTAPLFLIRAVLLEMFQADGDLHLHMLGKDASRLGLRMAFIPAGTAIGARATGQSQKIPGCIDRVCVRLVFKGTALDEELRQIGWLRRNTVCA